MVDLALFFSFFFFSCGFIVLIIWLGPQGWSKVCPTEKILVPVYLCVLLSGVSRITLAVCVRWGFFLEMGIYTPCDRLNLVPMDGKHNRCAVRHG